MHDGLHAEVGAKFGLVRGSQRKHEAVSVTEATRRHAKDRTTAIEARERELDEREVNAAIVKVNERSRTINERHTENVAAFEAAQDASAAAKEANEAEAQRLAQARRDVKADRMFLDSQGPAMLERKRREKVEADFADYRRKVEPLIKAAQRREAELTEREARWAREDADDERLEKANEREREREQAKKRGGALKELERKMGWGKTPPPRPPPKRRDDAPRTWRER